MYVVSYLFVIGTCAPAGSPDRQFSFLELLGELLVRFDAIETVVQIAQSAVGILEDADP